MQIPFYRLSTASPSSASSSTTTPASPTNTTATARVSAQQESLRKQEERRPPQATTFFDKVFQRLFGNIEEGKKHWLLNMLGYYSAESELIGVANGLYQRCVEMSRDETILRGLGLPTNVKYDKSGVMIDDGVGETLDFATRWELLSLHVYLTLFRLRRVRGAEVEKSVRRVMQDFFENFWVDVRHRMLIKEEGFKYLHSGKWMKKCEERFFGMALAFDKAWELGSSGEVEHAVEDCVRRNITCLNEDSKKIKWLTRYIIQEKSKLEGMSSNALINLSMWPRR